MSAHPLNTVLTAVTFPTTQFRRFESFHRFWATLLLDCKGRFFVMVRSSSAYWEFYTILGAHCTIEFCVIISTTNLVQIRQMGGKNTGAT